MDHPGQGQALELVDFEGFQGCHVVPFLRDKLCMCDHSLLTFLPSSRLDIFDPYSGSLSDIDVGREGG